MSQAVEQPVNVNGAQPMMQIPAAALQEVANILQRLTLDASDAQRALNILAALAEPTRDP